MNYVLTVTDLRKGHTYMFFRMRYQNESEIALNLQTNLFLASTPAELCHV